MKSVYDKWLFNIYSASKPATVTGAMQLYEKGMFLLDDPLYDFIPEFRDLYIHNPDGSVEKAKNPITLRHLFTMTSGLTYNTDTAGFEKAYKMTNGKMTTLDVARCIAEDGVVLDPQIGLSVFYTNHMLNPQEAYYLPRLRNVVYACINS